MKLERPVILAIVILVAIAAAAGGYYGYELWKEKQPLKVEKGDFVEIYYIGYFENGSIFDSSFSDENITKDTPFNESMGLAPLRAYIGDGVPSSYPEGWGAGNYNVIEGLWEGMLKMKEGDEKKLSIRPEKAYGLPVQEGITFFSDFTGVRLNFMIIDINSTNGTISLKWMPEIGEKFTMPMYWADGYIEYPYWIWENATEVISFNNTTATIKTTPNKMDDLTLFPFWENATEASFNDISVSLTTNPEIGSSFTYYGYTYNVEDVTEDKINISIVYGNETYYQEVDKTVVFNRTLNVTRIFGEIPEDYLKKDLKNEGYTSDEMAGETLYYKIKVNHIYKLG
ncbi:MAG: FKBP-type peptidyl-prolyl cis-trans isomerase [Candidatus Thermoplasmatota archaeon]|nr:FKBP-type peptidyl-prolyl cis-trans isomerase [Candidatus Thermoplasmatota archaeon]